MHRRQHRVVEHDAASTIRDINRELLGFLREVSGEFEAIPGDLSQFLPIVELLTKFINMISNMFDSDDILLQYHRKYHHKKLVDKRELETNMDKGLYKPVTFTATMAAE